MPTYELKCDACGKASELFLLRTLREEDKVCPECGSTDVRPGIGGGYFQISGSGDAGSASCGSAGSCSVSKRSAFG